MYKKVFVEFSLRPFSGAVAEGINSDGLPDAALIPVIDIAGGDLVIGLKESRWDGTFTISPLTFTLYQSIQRPETLGPRDVYLQLYESWYDSNEDLQIQVTRYAGVFTRYGGNYRAEETRTMIFQPFLKIDGGGARRNVFLQESFFSDASALHVNTRTGRYLTREGGTGQQEDNAEGFRKAHGLYPESWNR